MSLLVDFVGRDITPFLIYLGNKGIAPKVLNAVKDDMELQFYGFSDYVVIEKVLGRRLGDTLNITAKEHLESIYNKLGYSLGFIYKNLPIEHTDLHIYNVVVEKGPVIIDWGKALKVSDEEFNNRKFDASNIRDTKDVLDSTKEELDRCKKSELFTPLKDSLIKGLNEGVKQLIPETLDAVVKSAEAYYLSKDDNEIKKLFLLSLLH